jgi:secernin
VTTTQSTASWVADLRTGPRHWVTATSAPCTSVAKPVRVEEPVVVDPEPMPTNTYDAAYRWWRHERLHRLALRDHTAALARFVDERDKVEQDWLHDPPGSAEAFAAADDLEEAWLRDLLAADLTDTRPGWLRRRWRAIDRAAAMPDPAASGAS